MTWFDSVLVGLLLFDMLLTVFLIGVPRSRITPFGAGLQVLFDAALILGVVLVR